MPFAHVDPWRRIYFDPHDCPANTLIPLKDPPAYRAYPDHNWVYNKLLVAERQGLSCGPDGTRPSTYPVIVKPIMNLRSMGIGSEILHAPAQSPRPGTMWCQLLTGDFISTDLAVQNGTPVWSCQTRGHPLPEGMFDRWEIGVAPDSGLQQYLYDFVRKYLASYTGMLNFETIGGRIIEGHLRFAEQWPDLYPAGFVPSVIALYSRRQWPRTAAQETPGHSVILFGPGRPAAKPSNSVLAAWLARPEISSIQLPFHLDKDEDWHAMPPGGFRLAIINGWDLDVCRAARTALSDAFGFDDLGLAV